MWDVWFVILFGVGLGLWGLFMIFGDVVHALDAAETFCHDIIFDQVLHFFLYRIEEKKRNN